MSRGSFSSPKIVYYPGYMRLYGMYVSNALAGDDHDV